MKNKILRTLCLFTDSPAPDSLIRLSELAAKAEKIGYTIQTKRLCTINATPLKVLKEVASDASIYLSVSTLSKKSALAQLDDFCNGRDVNFNLDLTTAEIDTSDTNILFDIIRKAPAKTFSFTYVFNHAASSPYFPSARYERDGFSVGMQSPDLSVGCTTLEEWLASMSECWQELYILYSTEDDFLGIDSSVAPLFTGESSLINFIKKLGMNFSESVVTDTYLRITKHLKEANPKPVGLCGLMFPCLEDFELAEEYEKGNFSIERNLFLSLHSGLGIDTYPIGVDEKQSAVINILNTVQGLANKYKKPLAARFVSDGIAKVGDKTNFKNPYLKDVVIRPLF